MASRLNLHEELCEVLGSRNVYFQPPESLKLNFPCIIYERVGADQMKADDTNYITQKRYTVTVIDKDPDSIIPEKVGALQYASYDRTFVSNNMNHDVYKIYY